MFTTLRMYLTQVPTHRCYLVLLAYYTQIVLVSYIWYVSQLLTSPRKGDEGWGGNYVMEIRERNEGRTFDI